MQSQRTPTRTARTQANPFPARAAVVPDPRVALVDGYGYKIGVRDNMLCVSQNGSETRYPQAAAAKTSSGLARLVVVSDDGSISGRAFAWLRRNNVAVIHCNREGNSNFMSGAAVTDARLYRQQVLAQSDMPNKAIGVEIVRELLTAKIAGQVEVLQIMGRDFTRPAECVIMMQTAKDIQSMLGIEGSAASSYWRQWKGNVHAPWAPEAVKRLPKHWATFNGRSGVITRGNSSGEVSNRNATDFINSLLNMAYKFAEIECMFACQAFGLHPGIGISHGLIHETMPAMSLDLLEPCRPICDSIVLSYLDCGKGHPMGNDGKLLYWTKDAATEMEQGVCRLNKEVVYRLASAISMAVAPHAMHWAQKAAKTLTVTKGVSVAAQFDARLTQQREQTELAADATPDDLISDELWEAIEPLIPASQADQRWRSDLRTILAGIVAHEIYGIPWPKVLVKGDWRTCRRRLENWEESGAWEKIRAEVTRAGVSQPQSVLAS